MFQKILMIMCLAGSLFFLQGCDGGSSNSSKQEAPVIQTGFLVDAAVSGVGYSTPTTEGVTGSDGSFQYRENEVVRFTLGDTLLGEVPGAAQITPFELAGSGVITGTRNINEALGGENNPFYTVINLAVLLQSLDYDADSENGIEITPEIAALFQGVSVNLNQHWETFRDDWSLRHVIAMANQRALFGGRHGIREPGPALQHLYETVGINAPTYAVNSERRGPGVLGIGLRTYEYDEGGNMIGSQADHDGDGSAEETSLLQYQQGALTRFERTYTDGELPDQLETREYDALGNLARLENEGVIDPFESPHRIDHWQYDDYSSVTRHARDIDANGTPEQTDLWEYQYEFNSAGLITRLERDDVPGDGIYEFIVTWDYDPDGNMIRETGIDDYDGDGLPDEIKIAEFDASRNQTAIKYDRNGDGSPDSIEWWEYDERGNGILESHDENGDGVLELIEYYQYDEYDNVTLREYDDNADGTVDRSGIQQNEYDERGNRTLLAADYDGNGSVDNVEGWEYDARGNVTVYEHDEEIERWFYDDKDNVVRYESESVADGLIDHVIEYQYIATGWGHLFSIYKPSSDIFPIINEPSVIIVVNGREWLQPADFIGYTYDQVSVACPGGVCSGTLPGSTFDLTGYTWASIDEVSALFNAYGVTPPFTEPFQERDDEDVGVAFLSDFELTGILCDGDCYSGIPVLAGMVLDPAPAGEPAYSAAVSELPIPEIYRFFNTTNIFIDFPDAGTGVWFYRIP